MAVFYNKEKSKLGTLTGSIISFSTQLQTNEPSDTDNKRLLPSGYIRCDGSVYSATVYPLLAEILGTGDSCKFKQASTFLRADQFQVPNLSVKHIRASTGSNVGDFNDLFYETSIGTTLTKSGIGLDVISNLDEVYTLTYTGSFYLPSITVDLRGEPSFTRTTGDYTESSEIAPNGILPHAHFSSTVRSRTKNYGGSNAAQTQNNFNSRPTTLNVCTWYQNTKQELCQASAETAAGKTLGNVPKPGGILQNTSNQWRWSNMCVTTCKFHTSNGGSSCLIPVTTVNCPSCVYSFEFPAASTRNDGEDQNELKLTICPGNPGTIEYSSTGYLECYPSGTFAFIGEAGCFYNEPDGANGDSRILLSGSYGRNTVPFAAGNYTPAPATIAMGVSNITTTTNTIGNNAIHRHKVPLTAERHTYKMQTQSQIFSSEGLTSIISINTTAEKKADNYIQPYVVVEYLIKV